MFNNKTVNINMETKLPNSVEVVSALKSDFYHSIIVRISHIYTWEQHGNDIASLLEKSFCIIH